MIEVDVRVICVVIEVDVRVIIVINHRIYTKRIVNLFSDVIKSEDVTVRRESIIRASARTNVRPFSAEKSDAPAQKFSDRRYFC